MLCSGKSRTRHTAQCALILFILFILSADQSHVRHALTCSLLCQVQDQQLSCSSPEPQHSPVTWRVHCLCCTRLQTPWDPALWHHCSPATGCCFSVNDSGDPGFCCGLVTATLHCQCHETEEDHMSAALVTCSVIYI